MTYEYKILWRAGIQPSVLQERLNEYGEEGWRVIHVDSHHVLLERATIGG